MEIGLTLGASAFMAGLNALFTIRQTEKIKQAETKINIGGEQMKQILKEYDNHVKYIYKLNVIANEYILAYKEYYNTIKSEEKTIVNRRILLNNSINYEKYLNFNRVIEEGNNVDEIKILLDRCGIEGEIYEEIESKLDENTIFFAYCICSLLAWLQIKKKNNNNLHASVMRKDEGLQKSLDKFIDALNRDLTLSIPVHLQINLGESLIKYNDSNHEEEIRYSIIEYSEFKEKFNQIYPEYIERRQLIPEGQSFTGKNIIHFKEYTKDNQIIKTFGIVKTSEEYIKREKENYGFINEFKESVFKPLDKMYRNSKNMKIHFNSIGYRIDDNDIEDWVKILLCLLYITLFRYFSRDKNKIDAYQSEMRKNWKLFIFQLHRKNIFKSVDYNINLCDSATHLDLLIIKWENFFKHELLKRNLPINEIKSTFYINNCEAKYLKKYIQQNAIHNLNHSDKDTYKFIDKVNSNDISEEDKSRYFESNNINNLILQSKVRKFKNKISSDFEKDFIYTFKDIMNDFLIISDDYKLLDNLNTICNDISKYSEERILSDTKKRESLLRI